MKKIFIALVVATLLLIGASCVVTSNSNQPTPNPVVCAQDTKKCPGGSYVGRTGPNCEFANCPNMTPAPNSEKIIKKTGEREGSFEILEINSNNVVGFWYQAYPVARMEGAPRTLHIGDDIGYACEGISEKLTKIDFISQTITFSKVTGKRPVGGCPI